MLFYLVMVLPLHLFVYSCSFHICFMVTAFSLNPNVRLLVLSCFNCNVQHSLGTDLRTGYCSYAMPNASSSAMTMEATVVKIFGEAYEVSDVMLRSTMPGPSTS